MTDSKTIAKRLASSMLPLGALAAAAGCGGGGGSAVVPPHAAASATNAPATGGGVASSGRLVSAQLTVQIPARGARKAARRPLYVSPGSGAIGVSVVPNPAPAVTASPQLFTLPTPGPAPTSTTLTIQAPVGQDNITVNIYDVSPAATASPNLLSTGTTAALIAPDAANTPAVTALGVPQGVVLALASVPTPVAGATARPWTPLENVSAAQPITVSATAVDALGYAITGTLATAAPIAATGPVTLSASSVTTGSSTLTATYAANANAAGGVTSSLPLNTATATNNVTVTPDYDVFTSGGGYINTIDGVDQVVVSSLVSANAGSLASGSANGNAVAVAERTGALSVATVAPPTNAVPVPTATLSTLAVANLDTAFAPTFDASGNCYVAVTTGSTGTDGIVMVSGFGGTVTATQIGTVPLLLRGNGPFSGILSSAQGYLYVGEELANYSADQLQGATYKLGLLGGGAATPVDSNVFESVASATASSTLYKVWSSPNPSGCNATNVNLQDLAGSQTLATTTSTAVPTRLQAAHDGTMYFNNNVGVLYASTPLSSATLSSGNASFSPSYALTPDPNNTYLVGGTNSMGAQSVSFYRRSALASAQTPALVPLTNGTPTYTAAAP